MRVLGGSAKFGLLATVALAVCLAQVTPILPNWSAPQSAARAVSISGNVSVVKDAQPWALLPGMQVQPRQEIHTGADGYAVFEVYDGSTFEVFPNSRATFRHNPGSLQELMDLWIGRVKIHVQRLNGLPNPNRVKTPTAVISVRGTIFDVTVDGDDEHTLIVVEEGEVAVQHALLPYAEAKLLRAGEYLRVHKNMPIARRMDKGAIAQRVLSALSDLLMYRSPRIGGVGGGVPGGGGGSIPTPGGPGLPGDTGGGTPPPTAPPPPPPPPPL